MLRSMTGFGRCFLEEESWTQTWEIRSVNNRYLDIKWRLPAPARPLEAGLEKVVKRHASRGRVEISLSLQIHDPGRGGGRLNMAQASLALDELAALATSRGEVFRPDYNRLLGISHFWNESLEDMEDGLAASLEAGLAEALADWNEAREHEAAALEKDIRARILRMEAWLDCIRIEAPLIKEERFNSLRDRLAEVLEGMGQDLDDSRFLQEITLLSDKLDVSEEITRLASHLERLGGLLGSGEDAGRRLDFTLQECFREINTCGNKIQSARLSRLVVDFKNELEKCREQVQNME